MTASRPEGLIFDFDGLIVDTETPVFECWREVYREQGLDLALSDWQRCVGTRGGFDPLAPFRRWDDRRRQRMVERVDGMVLERVETGAPRGGVKRVLAEASMRGLRMAVASSSPSAWVERWLAYFGLREFFEAVCTGEEVSRVKPDPALYLLALDRLGVPAARGLAFEDSLNGYTAARRAGLACIVVPNMITASMPFPEECLRVPSMEDGLDALVERACRRPPVTEA